MRLTKVGTQGLIGPPDLGPGIDDFVDSCAFSETGLGEAMILNA